MKLVVAGAGLAGSNIADEFVSMGQWVWDNRRIRIFTGRDDYLNPDVLPGKSAKARKEGDMSTTVPNIETYPKEVMLRDGTRVLLKPMTPEDAAPLLQFFLRIPAEDRYYLKEDVTSLQVVQRWAAELDYQRALPLLAWVNGRVVADGTLHRNRAAACRHVGELRILVDPEYRNLGLGTAMLRELADIANESGLERLVFEGVAEKEDAAIRAAELVGFVRVAVLRGHARDPDDHPRDLVLMELPLGKWFEWWY